MGWTKQDKSFILIRIGIIVLWYFIRNMIWPIGTIFLYYPIFIPALIISLILLIVSTKVSERKSAVLRILSNSIFLVLFFLEIVYMLGMIFSSSDKGEAVFGFLSLIIYLPMVIFFIVWLIRDIKKYKYIRIGAV